jgi:hypothetical protein
VPAALLIGLLSLGQAKEDPAPSVLSSHLGMEIDDLDFEIRRQHDALQVARSRLAATQRSLQRGTASRSEVEQVGADVRSLEAREAEANAFRALKAYERDVLSGVAKADEERSFRLVLELLRAQELMAQVEVDFQAYRLNQDEALLVRGAISRPERDGARIDHDTARLHVALSRARQAQVTLEHAAGARPVDPDEVRRLKMAYLQARVRYYEIGLILARARLDMAKERLRLGRLSSSDVAFYQQAVDGAEALFTAERKRLEEPDAPTPSTLPRAG